MAKIKYTQEQQNTLFHVEKAIQEIQWIDELFNHQEEWRIQAGENKKCFISVGPNEIPAIEKILKKRIAKHIKFIKKAIKNSFISLSEEENELLKKYSKEQAEDTEAVEELTEE